MTIDGKSLREHLGAKSQGEQFPELLSAEDIKSATGLGLTKIWSMIGNGTFEAVRIGRLTRVRRGSFEAWLASLPPARENVAA